MIPELAVSPDKCDGSDALAKSLKAQKVSGINEEKRFGRRIKGIFCFVSFTKYNNNLKKSW